MPRTRLLVPISSLLAVTAAASLVLAQPAAALPSAPGPVSPLRRASSMASRERLPRDLAAPRLPYGPAAFERSRVADPAARAVTGGRSAAQPASVQSAPDGAGGQFIAWSDARDGSSDVWLLRVTNLGVAAAGWPADGVPVCTAPGEQYAYEVIADGAGGAFVTWYDDRDVYYDWDVWAQRISAAGAPLWTANGVKLAESEYGMWELAFAADGTGGLLAAWASGELGDVYATRITAAGALATGWTAGGEPVCTHPEEQLDVTVAPDGAGGAVVAWGDGRAVTNVGEIFAQRISAGGDPQWTTDGVRLDAVTTGAYEPAACAGPGGDVLVFWYEDDGTVRGQRLSAAGAAQWTAGGVAIRTGGVPAASETQAIPDGAGGALVAWRSFVANQGYEAQRVDGSGAVQWGAAGVALVNVAGAYPDQLDLAADGAGGGFFAWTDYRGGVNLDLYAQHVGPTGTPAWSANGAPVTTADGHQTVPRVAPDGAGGLLVCFEASQGLSDAVMTQRLSTLGAPLLGADGVTTWVDPGTQSSVQVFHMYGGDVIAVWMEKRNGQYDIRARKLSIVGLPVGPSIAVCDAPGDQILAGVMEDGVDGLIVAWATQNGDQMDLYAQRLDANLVRELEWPADGAPVCTAPGYRWLPVMTTDGNAGAIFTWMDYRGLSTDVYAQRLNSLNGAAMWQADGVLVCNSIGEEEDPVIASDGANGAIVLWSDRRNSKPQLFGQRLNAAGALQWAAAGQLISDYSPGDTRLHPISAVPASANGALVLVESPNFDFPTNTLSQRMYVQYVDGTGAPGWGPLGTPVLLLDTRTFNPQMILDGAGGVFIAWSDSRNGLPDIYGQRVNGTGILWETNGKLLCTAADRQLLGGIMRTGIDFVLTWTDFRSGAADIYAHRTNHYGDNVWPAGGMLVSGATRGQFTPVIAPWRVEQFERFYVGWIDNRTGDDRLAWVQRLGPTGLPEWGPDGVVEVEVALVAADAEPGRVRLTWSTSAPIATVYRRGTESDWTALATVSADGAGRIVYDDQDVAGGARYAYRLGVIDAGAERFSQETWVDVPAAYALALHGLTPNPATRDAALAFTLPRAGAATLEWLDVSGRRVRTESLDGLAAGRHVVRMSALPGPGVYFVRLAQDGRSVTARAAIVR